MVSIDDRDLYQLLISEFRYSVKRDNHLAPGTCVNLVMKYLPEMSKEWRAHTAEQLTSEIIQECIFGNSKGPLQQEEEWEKLLSFLTNYIEKLPLGVDRYMDVLFRKPLHVADIDYYSPETIEKIENNQMKK